MRLLLIFGLGLLLNACGPNLNDENSVLQKEVMSIHDDVMPKLTNIHKNKRLLQKALKVVTDENNKKVITLHIKKLNEADEAMMSWMENYDIPEDDIQAKEYLLKEKVEITKVRDLMLNSLNKSNEIIKTYEGLQ